MMGSTGSWDLWRRLTAAAVLPFAGGPFFRFTCIHSSHITRAPAFADTTGDILHPLHTYRMLNYNLTQPRASPLTVSKGR